MPAVTETSQDVTSFFTEPSACRVILNTMNDMSRADLHVHSSASQISKLGVQRSLHIPECATEPLEVYELAKRRGMDFVTITDHDTIEGSCRSATCPTRSSPRS